MEENVTEPERLVQIAKNLIFGKFECSLFFDLLKCFRVEQKYATVPRMWLGRDPNDLFH
jgi:hypothetical protein